MGKGQKLYKKAKTLIPGGTQLLSKRPEMFLPDYWPAYYKKAKGCEIWDLDGNHYYDLSIMGIGACVLGYASTTVSEAAKDAINNGNSDELKLILNKNPKKVGVIIMEIERHKKVDLVFLEEVRKIASKENIVLIYDEISS